MAITQIGPDWNGSATNTRSFAQISVDPALLLPGDIIVAAADCFNSARTWTTPGWTQYPSVAGSSLIFAVRQVGRGESGNYTFTLATNEISSLWARVYRGVDYDNPVPDSQSTSGVGPTTLFASVTAVRDNSLALYTAWTSGNRSFTPGAGMTEEADQIALGVGGTTLFVGSALQNTGTGSALTAIPSGSATYNTVALILNPALDAQRVFPGSDVSASGWQDQSGGTTNLFAALDETTASDTDYVTTMAGDAETPGILELTLPGLSAPGSGGPLFVTARLDREGPARYDVDGTLKQGATPIATRTLLDAPEDWGERVVDFTASEVSGVSDWSAARLALAPRLVMSPSPAPDMMIQSGRWIDPNLVMITNQQTAVAVSANTLYACPLYIPYSQPLDQIGVGISTSSPGNVRVGLYTMEDDGLPGTKLAESSEMTSNPSGQKTTAISYTPERGWYYIVCHFSATPNVYGMTAPPAWAGADPTAWATPNQGALTVSTPYGPLPATFPLPISGFANFFIRAGVRCQ